ncbi:Variant surface glycoprotein [Trypanosoma congolense IL3000]|uniref:Variant surface glycoprotein n=1 Tax=Trypanosoma congolense (strain IL3000) TaxID=1068625 RepID=F9WK83_TRYCI|nr:Variant surface glycoprotein [Trypanosoma congolense IL3000]
MLQRGVTLLLFLFSWSMSSTCEEKHKQNAGEAELFCRIRLLAENDPEKLVFENEEREKHIMRQSEKIGPEIRSLVGKSEQRDATLITQFNDLVKEAKKIIENMRDLRRKAAEKRLSAKRHLHQVIFGEYGGEGKGELDTTKETIQKIFNNEKFEKSCGGQGDKPAGKSLINDFICLCASNTGFDAHFDSHKDRSICKYGVTTTVEANFKNWTEVWYWNKHRICINTAPPIPTPQNINYLVAHFTRFLEREQKDFQVKNVFGYVKTTDNPKSVCNTTNVGSICVNYIHALSHGGIEWVNHLKNASQDLKDMVRYAEESESSLPQLELLEYNALLLYEEAKYSTHLPHIVPSNETETNSSNEGYEESSPNSTNASQGGEFEEEEDADSTWKARPPWWGMPFFFLFDF